MQLPFSLDSAEQDREILALADAEICLIPHFLDSACAEAYYQRLLKQTPWQQDSLNFGGKQVLIPRLQAWYGDRKSSYGYSGLSLAPLPWTAVLLDLKSQVEEAANAGFNSVLLNYYRNGQDSVAWHSDDESELGDNPVIASLSLGCVRRFELKHRSGKWPKAVCELGNGSLIIMGHGVQQHWQHCIPKQPGITEGRINLTFRYIHA